MRKFVGRPSPAMIVACLALFVAMTGTSIAASKYLITSTSQIKPSVIKQLKGAKGPRGPAGPAGAPGAAGAAGAAGASGATHVVKRVAVDTTGPWIDYSFVTATCNPGETVVGGGATWVSSLGGLPVVTYSTPTPVDNSTTVSGWAVEIDNGHYYDTGYAGTIGSVQAVAFVLCASP